ncbi:hypothetical protein N9I49_00275 [Flavobacteriaceae bacterium]|nr:hypothetical protein [Flavobacteriaceae bacterium]
MASEYVIIDNVCQDDEHLVTNLTLIKYLKRVKKISNVVVCKSAQKYYLKFNFDVSIHNNLFFLKRTKLIFLTASWKILFFTLLFRRNDVIIFHNFFSFLNGKTFFSKVKRILFNCYLKSTKCKNYVLSKHISKNLNTELDIDFDYIPLWHDLEIINNITSEVIKVDKEIIIFGNIYRGKFNNIEIDFNKIIHLGKLHGDVKVPFKSINKYLKLEDYYSYFKGVDTILVSYVNYSYIASGIIADSVALNKNIISNLNEYTLHLINEYGMNITSLNGIKKSNNIKNEAIQILIFNDFIKQLKKIE